MPCLFPGLISVSLPGISTELCVCQRSRLLLLLLACLSPSITIYGAKDFVSGPLVPSLHQRVTRIHVVKQSKAIISSLLSRFVDSRAGKWRSGILGSKALAAASPHPTSKIVTIGSVTRCLRLLSGQWNTCVVWTLDPFCVLGLPNLYTVCPAVILWSGVKGFFRLWRDECDVCYWLDLSEAIRASGGRLIGN